MGREKEGQGLEQRRHGYHQRRRMDAPESSLLHAHAHHRPRRMNKRKPERKGWRTDAGDADDPCGATDEDMRLDGRGYAIPPRLGDAQRQRATRRGR
jgi:hypothetical protein